jgi:hypothetical protein
MDSIHIGLFGSCESVSAWFGFDAHPAAGHPRQMSTAASGYATFQPVMVQYLGVGADGGAMSFVAGTITADSGGTANVAGLVVTVPDAVGSMRNIFIPGSQPSHEEMAAFALPEGPEVGGDVSSAEGGGGNSNQASEEAALAARKRCLQASNAQYNNCIAQARSTNAACLAAAAVALAAALARCASTATVPLFGWLITSGCVVWAIALGAAAVSLCSTVLAVNLRRCAADHEARLAGCGFYQP